MYAVIAGAGEVGFRIAKTLYREGFNLAVIEQNSEAADEAESLDALIVRGNAASMKKLEEAGIANADVLFAVTGSDEINILACAAAKSKGVKTIARINSLDYINEPVTNQLSRFGVDVAICPDLVTATKISRILTMPSLMDVDIFVSGKVQITETRVKRTSPIAHKSIKELNIPARCNIVAIFRNSDVIIPHGGTKLLPDDRLVLSVADPRIMIKLDEIFGETTGKGPSRTSIEKIMIVGATRTGLSLAQNLEKRAVVVLLDENEEACRRASEQLSNTLVINGSGTDEQLLVEEGIETIDAFVAMTNHEDTNILSCLLAKEYGARKTIALINRPGLKSMFEHIGIDVALSPMMATVSVALRYTYKAEMLGLSVLHDGDAKVLEMRVRPGSRIEGKTLRKVRFPEGTVVAAVARGNEVLIPKGDDVIRGGDRLVVFAKTEAVPKLEPLFTKRKLLG